METAHSLSIIIPTHKRAPILRRCLEHLKRQTIANELEVVVVSDGQDEETAALFRGTHRNVPVRFFEMEACQQGVARNRGVQEALSAVCLFIGDDIFLAPDACERHLRIRPRTGTDADRAAILGFTTWDPSVGITPVMRWLERSGWQFGYGKIRGFSGRTLPRAIQHLFTYTSHISIPTDIARAMPFREDARLYGWEDIEWGTRLAQAGIHLIYEPDAKSLHHHRITTEESLQRMETLGRSVVELSKANPALDRLPRGLKRAAYAIAALLPTMAGRHRRAFLRGVGMGEDAQESSCCAPRRRASDPVIRMPKF